MEIIFVVLCVLCVSSCRVVLLCDFIILLLLLLLDIIIETAAENTQNVS